MQHDKADFRCTPRRVLGGAAFALGMMWLLAQVIFSVAFGSERRE